MIQSATPSTVKYAMLKRISSIMKLLPCVMELVPSRVEGRLGTLPVTGLFDCPTEEHALIGAEADDAANEQVAAPDIPVEELGRPQMPVSSDRLSEDKPRVHHEPR
jgi:hypothetical protein